MDLKKIQWDSFGSECGPLPGPWPLTFGFLTNAWLAERLLASRE
jgi:hypothetical protein